MLRTTSHYALRNPERALILSSILLPVDRSMSGGRTGRRLFRGGEARELACRWFAFSAISMMLIGCRAESDDDFTDDDDYGEAPASCGCRDLGDLYSGSCGFLQKETNCWSNFLGGKICCASSEGGCCEADVVPIIGVAIGLVVFLARKPRLVVYVRRYNIRLSSNINHLCG